MPKSLIIFLVLANISTSNKNDTSRQLIPREQKPLSWLWISKAKQQEFIMHKVTNNKAATYSVVIDRVSSVRASLDMLPDSVIDASGAVG